LGTSNPIKKVRRWTSNCSSSLGHCCAFRQGTDCARTFPTVVVAAIRPDSVPTQTIEAAAVDVRAVRQIRSDVPTVRTVLLVNPIDDQFATYTAY
jgi:hypothetical protein